MTVPRPRRSRLAFLFAVPIGLLGGLIGLGGAEFRLPVLAGPLGYPARRAVPLNLAISLVTLAASLAIRSRTLSLEAVFPFRSAVLALIGGAVVAAFAGVGWASRLKERHLERIIVALLVAIGLLLIVEGFLPQELPGLVPAVLGWQVAVGALAGLGIGLVSSVLGVAGGELIIPTMVFLFGADIKTAGTASLIISLPTVVVGVARYAARGALAGREALADTVAPMSAGSILGAVAGGLLVGLVPTAVLKMLLGIILNVSAIRMFSHQRANTKTTEGHREHRDS